MIDIRQGDCLKLLDDVPEGSVDAVITDPPYALTASKRGGSGAASLNLTHPAGRSRITTGGGFMGQKWDSELPTIDHWLAVLRVLKPGGYMVAFGGARTYHRLVCCVEDAGFEIRDCIMWIYGSGFPKHKACLKPAYEPILLARKRGKRSTPLGIDECRVVSGERQAERIGEATQNQQYTNSGSTNFAAKPGRRYKVKRLNPGATVNATGKWGSVLTKTLPEMEKPKSVRRRTWRRSLAGQRRPRWKR